MQTHIIHEGIFGVQQEKSSVHLPFDMPQHAVRLEISYSYSNRISSDVFVTGGNTLDLGLFDQRGIAFLNAGFRGWSGSERPSFFMTESEATPGYLPGPLLPGRWHVYLGLYKIAAHGCRYRIDISITTKPGHVSSTDLPAAVSTLPSSPPLARHAPWLCGELHCHTRHSDGDCSPAELVALARQRGLDFLAVSDHNTMSSHQELARLSDPGRSSSLPSRSRRSRDISTFGARTAGLISACTTPATWRMPSASLVRAAACSPATIPSLSAHPGTTRT